MGEGGRRKKIKNKRPAGQQDLPFLKDVYHLISPEEMKKVVERQTLLLGYREEQWIGFIGEHLEGSIGLLYIFPEFRRGTNDKTKIILSFAIDKKGEKP